MSINTNDDSQHSSCSEPLTPPHMVETANAVSLNLLPEKSKERYVKIVCVARARRRFQS